MQKVYTVGKRHKFLGRPDPKNNDRHRCGAKLHGQLAWCRRWPVKGKKRCRLHGGLSTGAKTPEGKARSRFNAVKHGLSATIPVLPGEDPDAFRRRQEAWAEALAPGDVELARALQLRLDGANKRFLASVRNLALTRELQAGARIFHLRVLDHLIVGAGRYVSLARAGGLHTLPAGSGEALTAGGKR